MRTLLYIIGGLVVLVVAAVVALPYVVPQETLRTAVARQLERATGHDVALTGEVRLAVLPRPTANVGGLAVAGAENVEGPPLLTLDRLDARLALLPLVSGEIQVDRFVLRGLDVALIVDEAGRANWTTGAAGDAGGGAGGDGGGPAAPDTAPALPAVSLGDVRLVDGAVRYVDRAAGTDRTFADIDGTVAMSALDAPLTVDLRGELDGRPVELDGRLAALGPLLQGGGSGVELALASAGLDVNFAGDVALGTTPEVAGEVDLAVREAEGTLAWLAGEPVAVPLETLQLSGALAASPSRVALDALELGVDDVRGTGRLAVALDAVRPAVTGRLDLGAVDLAAFAGDDAAATPGDGSGGGDTSRTDGWSRQPLNYTPPPVDLDLDLSVESLNAPPLAFGAGALNLRNNAERLAITLEELGLYDGEATGTVTVRPAGGGLALETDVALANVRTGPLLEDLAGAGFLDGRADLTLAVASRGATQYELVAGADGDAGFSIDRAVLKRLEGKPELETLRALLALGGEPGEPLRIASASGTVDLADGIATNRDLVASTANLRLTGAGRVDLVDRRVPGYTLTPEATGALAGARRLQALLVPLVIQGPFDALKVRPDPDAVATGAVEEVERALDAAGEKAREGDLEGAAETIINEGLGGALERFGIRP